MAGERQVRVVFRAYCGNGWMIDKATRKDAESIASACEPMGRVREVTIRPKAAVAKDSIGRCIACGLFRCQCKSQMPPQSPSAAVTPTPAGAPLGPALIQTPEGAAKEPGPGRGKGPSALSPAEAPLEPALSPDPDPKEATTPIGRPEIRCATEGCNGDGLHFFERGDVGSYHCQSCFAKLEKLDVKRTPDPDPKEVEALVRDLALAFSDGRYRNGGKEESYANGWRYGVVPFVLRQREELRQTIRNREREHLEVCAESDERAATIALLEIHAANGEEYETLYREAKADIARLEKELAEAKSEPNECVRCKREIQDTAEGLPATIQPESKEADEHGQLEKQLSATRERVKSYAAGNRVLTKSWEEEHAKRARAEEALRSPPTAEMVEAGVKTYVAHDEAVPIPSNDTIVRAIYATMLAVRGTKPAEPTAWSEKHIEAVRVVFAEVENLSACGPRQLARMAADAWLAAGRDDS